MISIVKDSAASFYRFGSEQATFSRFEPDMSHLTDAEREVYGAVRLGTWGVRDYARHTGRFPGTVGNLLARAEDKVSGGSGRD